MPRQADPELAAAAHARWLAKRRGLLAFIRACTEPGAKPQFYDIARLARARGLFPRRAALGAAELALRLVWPRQAYFDSPAANGEQRMKPGMPVGPVHEKRPAMTPGVGKPN